MKKTIIVLLLLLVYCKLSAQYTNLKFENLSTIDGLSSSTCIDIFEDSEGFIWFGTIDGLNRYDGYNFKVYRAVINDPFSISSNRITSITEDNNGRLWFSTAKGLNVFDKDSEKFYRINNSVQNPNSLSNDLIYGMLFDKKKNVLWITAKDAVNKIELANVDISKPETLSFTRYKNQVDDPKSLDTNEATTILMDNDGAIWVATSRNSLSFYNPATDKFEQVPIPISNEFELDHIPRLTLIDNDGNFWIGNNLAGLIFWNKKENIFSIKKLTDKRVPIFQIYQDRKGVIWIASDGDGLYFLDKNKGVTDHIVHNPANPFSLSNNQPSRILEDRNGIVWIGTYNTGINKIAFSKSEFGHIYHQPGNPNSLSHKIAQSVVEDKSGKIWIGTDGGGLNLYDEQANSFIHFRNNPADPNSIGGDKIVYLCVGQTGLWICTWQGGLNKLDFKTKRITRYKHNEKDPFSIGQNSIWCAVEDSHQRLWIGTQAAGLNLFDPVSERFYQYTNDQGDSKSLLDNFIVSVFIDSKNRLFVGTATGLNVTNLDSLQSMFPDKIKFKNFKPQSLNGHRINYISETKNGNIWVGSDLGLNKLDADLNLLRTYTTIDGLPNNLITGIKEDDMGNLWLTTKSGLSQLDPATNKFRNYNTHDGIQGMEFQSKSIFKTHNGRIIVGGINGFNIFDPKKILADTISPRLLLTDFSIFNRSIKANDTINGRVILNQSILKTNAITLRYNEAHISFEYLALNYSNPEKFQYAYRMEGLDKDWNYVGSTRKASYSNLAPGEYKFEVMTSSDGSWNRNKKLSLSISILPPPWKTWWAYVLYALFISALLYVGLRYYTQRVREEKEHELDQMKLMFFINVSHEFRTPLTLILNPIEKILSAYTNPEEVKTSALTIQRSARKLLNLVNQLLDFRKTDLGKAPLETVEADIVSFSRDIFLLFSDLAEIKKIDFRFDNSVESLISWFDPDKLEKILTNLLSNSIKFTEVGGKITLSIAKVSIGRKGNLSSKTSNEFVELKVIDTGVGLKEEQLKHVFEPFFHVDNSKSGTGIGLAFTKSLVELHHGHITVESEYGSGSTFTVMIPLNEKGNKPEYSGERMKSFANHNFDPVMYKSLEYELAIDNEIEDEKIDAAMAKDTDRKPVLLIIEDNKELRVHLKNELRSQFKVREAVNGVDGLEKITKYFPDIIISDIMMPEMDGFELCRRIKKDIETCHIPIVLLTARSLETDRIEGYQTGADEYLPKPFNIYVLKARLKNLLESRQRLKEKFISTAGVLPAKDVTTNTLDEVFLDRVTKVILENISDPDFSLENLLESVGISRSHFFRKISSLTGQNPSNFIRTVKLKYAAGMLVQQNLSIKEVSYQAGFNSSAYFSKTFRELFGKTPQQYVEDAKKNA